MDKKEFDTNAKYDYVEDEALENAVGGVAVQSVPTNSDDKSRPKTMGTGNGGSTMGANVNSVEVHAR